MSFINIPALLFSQQISNIRLEMKCVFLLIPDYTNILTYLIPRSNDIHNKKTLAHTEMNKGILVNRKYGRSVLCHPHCGRSTLPARQTR